MKYLSRLEAIDGVAIFFAAGILLVFILVVHLYGSSFPDFQFSDASTMKAEQIKDLYDRRMKKYATDQELFVANLKLQGIVLIISLVLLYMSLDSVKIEGLGFKLPAIPVQAFLPIVLLYLWLSSGYLLHELIDNRTILWHLVTDVDSVHRAVVNGQNGSAIDPYNVRLLLRDDFFLDEYFLAFSQSLADIQEGGMWVLNRIILIAFGLFWGLSQGCVLATIANVIGEAHSLRYGTSIGWVYMAFAAILLLGSHLQFYLAGHPNWLQYVILVTCLVSTFLFSVTAKGTRPTLQSAPE